MDWKLNEEKSTTSSCELELADTEGTRKIYPFSFKCTCFVVLKTNLLKYKLTIQNKSDIPMNFTCGLQTYLHTTDIDTATVKGSFRGGNKINQINIVNMESILLEKNSFAISEFTDDIQRESLSGSFTLFDSTKPSLIVSCENGWKDIVVWNP